MPRRKTAMMYAGIAVLACMAVIGMAFVSYDQDEGFWDDGSVTLAQLNKQEMNEILAKAKSMSTDQLRAEVAQLEADKRTRRTSLASKVRKQSLVVRGGQEDVAGNPEGGIIENVPPTVVAPVPGPPDFNGASAIIARLPNIGFAPSMLTEKGFETRGSFTVRKSRAGESFYLRVYGKLNHNMRCTLRGYRNLMGDFTGNTIYTGFKKIYTGKSQVQTGHIPRGIVGEFDIMTCRDLNNGEVQYFRIRYD
ncbi:hypothetical protein GUITHDRAFT_150128 [Guillardia theta CCMP2712]|uniref:Uncharacterized protein n=1 Tax=Guillardia theta (strain CCMP2712) TaxID=905079 RepID=L1K0Q8_GUITC|nr:hypothetical protein GUITHDRAFT_150128 [Guillardia theta CCMP2712]EKX54035.1 hypothetical protein GUITHDRAFT_150128 [Guillardia theta CCMP2712]|eukprot:XP_005841015.1 hypothetical protein GUITHDRAFT_150128 [Guillardia theta CCMP2712]